MGKDSVYTRLWPSTRQRSTWSGQGRASRFSFVLSVVDALLITPFCQVPVLPLLRALPGHPRLPPPPVGLSPERGRFFLRGRRGAAKEHADHSHRPVQHARLRITFLQRVRRDAETHDQGTQVKESYKCVSVSNIRAYNAASLIPQASSSKVLGRVRRRGRRNH